MYYFHRFKICLPTSSLKTSVILSMHICTNLDFVLSFFFMFFTVPSS